MYLGTLGDLGEPFPGRDWGTRNYMVGSLTPDRDDLSLASEFRGWETFHFSNDDNV